MKKTLVPIIIIFAISILNINANALTDSEISDFLRSTLTLPDRVDYTDDFYEANIAATLAARKEMPWGKTIPDREFLHFVLPVRVNNENPDLSRPIFYNELKDRVKNLSIKDAILEVNHWCHEKVTYQPSDARTSAPLATVCNALGRCGEESTFTVAALRSVGIPARQIYTPRWAHTDDNHAWVEVWADGQWYFLGACEPEPVLNLAWFNDPAARGMLMATNVAGDYDGPEEKLFVRPYTTRINVTSNYAPVESLQVEVLHSDGSPAKNAKVNFCLYNYAEFYPVASKTADNDGKASLNAGLGDMIIIATDGDRFGIAKGNSALKEPVRLVLDKDANSIFSFDFDIIPPAPISKSVDVSDGLREANNRRLQKEDSIRNAYTSTFATNADGYRIAERLGLDSDRFANLLVKSRGNHVNLVKCLENLSDPDRNRAFNLLMNVTEKDLHDITPEVILSHIAAGPARFKVSDEIYDKYILSPRIENEGLRAWRKPLMLIAESGEFGSKPEDLIQWIDKNIGDIGVENPFNLRISPEGVLKSRKADPVSRDIFFVAASRAMGFPAMIDPITSDAMFMDETGKWITARFNDLKNTTDKRPIAKKGFLKVNFTPENHIIDPKYYSQFSISKIIDGEMHQLEFDENGTLSSLFSSPVELEEGQYILTSGQRLANGGVLSHSEVFRINPGETRNIHLKIRHDESELAVIGSLNAENIYHDLSAGTDKSILSTTGRGYYILGFITPNHEPSVHALNDISAAAASLEAYGRPILLLFDTPESASRFRSERYPNLPANVRFGIDMDGVSRNEIIQSLHMENADNPLFVVADTFNRIIWESDGYTIGIGERLSDILSRLTP
ncbi:MAG: transglutaminase-like domain-containing protein [Muribaculaceae bacterium]|nr:transglutaminase-like domain-containing protein [Muribaculaceae bacterium]